MDEDVLDALAGRLVGKGRADTGQGDYQDLLWAVMNAKNNGAHDEDILDLFSRIPKDRRLAMQNNPSENAVYDPFVVQTRRGLDSLLKRFNS